MILYLLHCANDHDFEAWFHSSAAFEDQIDRREVECPYCGGSEIRKAPMAPNLLKSRQEMRDALSQSNPDKGGEERARQLASQILEAFQQVRAHIEATSEYVGENFADEARAIHHGEAEERSIYGESTSEQAEGLEEEGIPIARIPWPAKRQ